MATEDISDSVGAKLFEALGKNVALASELFGETPDSVFNHKPGPKSWSAAECFEHLMQTHRFNISQMERSIAKARQHSLAGSPPYEWKGRMGKFVLRTLNAGKKKVKAPKSFGPQVTRSDYSRVDRLKRYAESVGRMQAQVTAADGLDLAKITIPPPVLTFIRYSLGLGFEIMAAHDLRHIRQAERAVKNAGKA